MCVGLFDISDDAVEAPLDAEAPLDVVAPLDVEAPLAVECAFDVDVPLLVWFVGFGSL